MQKRLSFFILPLFLFLSTPFAGAEGDPLRSIRQRSDEVYRLSLKMVEHGADGHTDEISAYGKKVMEQTEKLIEAIQLSRAPELEGRKRKIIAPLKMAIERTKEALKLADQGAAKPALNAARKASFQVKKSRQEMQAIQ